MEKGNNLAWIKKSLLEILNANASVIPNAEIEEIEQEGVVKPLVWKLLGHTNEMEDLHWNYIRFAELYLQFLIRKESMRVLWKVDENWSVFYCPIYNKKRKILIWED